MMSAFLAVFHTAFVLRLSTSTSTSTMALMRNSGEPEFPNRAYGRSTQEYSMHLFIGEPDHM